MMDDPCVLFIDDDPNVLSALKRIFQRKDYTVLTCLDGNHGIKVLAENDVAVVVVDQRMPGQSGIEVLRKVQDISPDTIRVMLTGHIDVELALDATNRGEVYRIIRKPWDELELQVIICQCLEKYNLIQENRRLQAQLLNQTRVEMVKAMIITLNHEINNPLSALALDIQTLSRAFENKQEPDDYAEILESMGYSYKRIAELIAKLKDVEEVKLTEYLPGQLMVDAHESKPLSKNNK